jgi:hypothetical protein
MRQNVFRRPIRSSRNVETRVYGLKAVSFRESKFFRSL